MNLQLSGHVRSNEDANGDANGGRGCAHKRLRDKLHHAIESGFVCVMGKEAPERDDKSVTPESQVRLRRFGPRSENVYRQQAWPVLLRLLYTQAGAWYVFDWGALLLCDAQVLLAASVSRPAGLRLLSCRTTPHHTAPHRTTPHHRATAVSALGACAQRTEGAKVRDINGARERERERESKGARKSKRAREQESKRAREQERGCKGARALLFLFSWRLLFVVAGTVCARFCTYFFFSNGCLHAPDNCKSCDTSDADGGTRT